MISVCTGVVATLHLLLRQNSSAVYQLDEQRDSAASVCATVKGRQSIAVTDTGDCPKLTTYRFSMSTSDNQIARQLDCCIVFLKPTYMYNLNMRNLSWITFAQ